MLILLIILLVFTSCKQKIVNSAVSSVPSEVASSNSSSNVSASSNLISSSFVSSSGIKKTYEKDKSLSTKTAIEAIEFIKKLVVEDIPPYFSSIENLDKSYAETIALFQTEKHTVTNDNNAEKYFYALHDVEETAKSIFGNNVKISNKGCYTFEFKPEKNGYEMVGFGIEASYIPIAMKCSEENNKIIVYCKLLFLTDGFYDNKDQNTLLSMDEWEAANISKAPLYKFTLEKKSGGGFYYRAFEQDK